MPHAVGIDLGTTNSVVAFVDEDGRQTVFSNEHGNQITPSIVWFDADRIVVGDEAKSAQKLGDPNVASFFKRQMGDPHHRFVTQNREYSAPELSACVLRSLKADAERELNCPVTDAVITVPAYFHDPERKATLEAGRLAGLNVLQLINEPTAAAIAYGVAKPIDGERRILVFDLGGGTFDVTLLVTTLNETLIKTSDGDAELGGKDWDRRIVDFIAAEFLAEHGINPLDDAVSIGDLWIIAEDAKRQLTDRQTTKVLINHDGERGRFELTRDRFDILCHDLVARTVDTVMDVLREQSITPADIDEVLLVGGSTRMPMIREALKSTFGRPSSHGVNEDQVVALGAAICARGHVDAKGPTGLAAIPCGETTGTGLVLPGGGRIRDVTSHSLGMIAVNDDQSAYINTIILPKNETIPRRESRPYQHRTRPGDDNRLEIFMTQGERDAPDQVTYLGRYVINRVPHDPSGTAVVEVDYAYDLSGSVQVDARLASDGTALEIAVESLPEDIPYRFLQPPETETVAHVTVYLAFDLSGSMSGPPLQESQRAADQFLTKLSLSHCSMGILAVADETRTVLEACQNASRIRKAVSSLSIGMVGYGNEAHPFDEALRLLRNVDGPRFVVTLADGVWSNQPLAVRQARALHEAGIDIIAIGFGGADRQFLKDIASCDEGSIFTSMNGLSETFSSIAQVMTNTQGGNGLITQGKKQFWGQLSKRR